MIALIQRVTQAEVSVSGNTIARIGQGILVFIAIENNDTETQSLRLAKRLLNYRIFADSQDKMNLSVQEITGDLLIVPQFTLAADTRKGSRPSFSRAASVDISKNLFNHFVSYLKTVYKPVECGVFAADMQVSLVNDGPATFLLKLRAPS